ncbi:MAG: helix-turn-helix domain-containing protein [Nitrospirae bacterium]|nr:helix-turn-helix domain-containing protein [Nitrospirota bacterium]
MAKERVSMRKVKEILRLYWEEGLSRRQIAKSCNISRSAVSEYIARAEKAGLRHPLSEELDDATIEAKLFPKEEPTGKDIRPMPAMEEIHRELQKKGVTLQLLWLEYKDKYPGGINTASFASCTGNGSPHWV